MIQLSVNVNKIATLRNSRGENAPHLLSLIKHILSYNISSITAHPRPDQRHIKYQDIKEIKNFLTNYNKDKNKKIEFNIEGYPCETFIKLILDTKPNQCTLVPDPPHSLTSDTGWDLKENETILKKTTTLLRKNNIRVSLFIDPLTWDLSQKKSLLLIQPDRVEFYTKPYVEAFKKNKYDMILNTYEKIYKDLKEHKIDCNAGHDLNLENLSPLIKKIPGLKEVSIGHALICDSLKEGLQTVIPKYQKKFQD